MFEKRPTMHNTLQVHWMQQCKEPRRVLTPASERDSSSSDASDESLISRTSFEELLPCDAPFPGFAGDSDNDEFDV